MVNNLSKIFAVVFILISCNNDMKRQNNLKNETSPYLLQHVENPVNWNPWDKKYLNKAKSKQLSFDFWNSERFCFLIWNTDLCSSEG